MLPKWTVAILALAGAGAAEALAGLANRVNFLSIILGAATLVVALLAKRRGRFDAGAWVVAVLGASLAFRLFVYQAPPLATALVGASGALYVATVFLAFSAWRAEAQALARA